MRISNHNVNGENVGESEKEISIVIKSRWQPNNFVSDNAEGADKDTRAKIVALAKKNGSYLKAPNGKPTNLSPKQWAQVRTKAFKEWFGDWEKAARIEKLRKSKSVEIAKNANESLFELNRASVREYMLNNLRGKYTNHDTGHTIEISRKGVQKVTSHSAGNEAHLKSAVAIPKMLENAIFINEVDAEKDNAQYDAYRYYVCGLRIGSEDYTVRITIGVKGNKFYYDHYLTDIEKGNLIEIANGFTANGGRTLPSYAKSKDTRIIPLLQTNSSKVVDENGEPKVVYNGSKVQHYQYDGRLRTKGQSATNSKVSFFTDSKAVAERYGKFVNEVFLFVFDMSRIQI